MDIYLYHTFVNIIGMDVNILGCYAEANLVIFILHFLMMGIYCLLILWKILVYLFTVYVLFCHHSVVCYCSKKITKR